MVRWRQVVFLFLLLASPLSAQIQYPPIRFGTAPPATCNPATGPGEINLFWDTDDFVFRYCSATDTWSLFGGGGGDAITVNTTAVVDPDFIDTGTITVDENLVPTPDTIAWNVVANSINATHIDETAAYAFSSATNSFLGASFTGPTADPADAGVLRLSNGEQICWEAAPTGADFCITGDSTERIAATTFVGALVGNADTATTATTATTANAGDSATAFFTSGVLEITIGGTGSAPGADDQALISDSTSAGTWRSIPNCNTEFMLTYATATNSFGCESDTGGGGANWEALANSADTATSYVSNNTAETVTFDFQSAFTTGDQFTVKQTTGNPSGGTLFAVIGNDASVAPLARFDMNIDAALSVDLDSGTTATQITNINFFDQGVLKHRIRKDASNSLLVLEGAVTRFNLSALADSVYRTGSATSDHIFTDSTPTIRARILGDADTLALGAAEDTLLTRSAAGIVGVTSVVDAATGFRIGGAAASTNALIGNGTNFVAGQISSSQLATANKTFMKSFTIFDPTTGDSNDVQMYFGQAVTITRVACSVAAATSVTIQLDERAEATPNTAGTDVMTAALVCDVTSEATTSFTNAGIAARVPLNLQVTAVAGTPGAVRGHIEYVVD